MPGPTLATVKRLFAVSGNVCVFEGCSAPLVDPASGKVTGRICHICARSPDGPRYSPDQTNDQRHGFDNLLLLCPVHHDVIDADPMTYTVERLRALKAAHEARHAGGAEPSEEVAAQFLVHVGDVVYGDKVMGPKIIQQAAVAATTALHQLPAPPADFTGREDELAALCAAVEAGGATISGLRGMGGVGKTALALKLAEQLISHYPDAQIYLDLQGTTQPLTPAQAMAHVVRAYYPTEKLPDDEAGLAALYRSTLHGQRALLLMDNAAGREQVEMLLPPPSCLLLITSRRHFTLPGLRGVNLDALPLDDARALLRRIAPRLDEGCAGEVAQLCGCLPLALRLAGSALAERVDLAPARYLARLRDAQARLGLVEASISLSYDLLGEDLQRLWCLLAVFPADFGALAATSVWEMEADPTRDARDALGELVRYSLLGWNQEAARYRLHDLARLYADARLEGAEREKARRRHAWHYAFALYAVDRLYEQGGEALLRGLALFDLEWPNVQAGQAWAAARAEEDEAVARLCSTYYVAGGNCLNLRLHPRERVAWLEVALAVARQTGDRRGEGIHLCTLGVAYSDLGQVERAIEHYEQALAIALEIGDRGGEMALLGNLGNAYKNLGRVEEAIEHHQQALAISRETGDRGSEGVWLGNLGVTYADLGRVEEAIEHHQQALVIAREIGDRRNEGVWLANLGVAYSDLGQVERARELWEQALRILEEVKDSHAERVRRLLAQLEWLSLLQRIKSLFP